MPPCDKPGVFLAADRYLNLFSDRSRHVTLQSKHVPHLAVVGLRPEVLISGSPNQLCVNAHATAFAQDRAFDNGIDTQRFSNLWQRNARIFETHYRGARDDTKPADHR